MRRSFLIGLGFLLCGLLAAQQRLPHPENYVGFNAGASLSMMRFNPKLKVNLNYGFSGGLVWRYISDKHFGLQAELNYSERGWREPDTSYNRTLGYLEIPFLTHLYFGRKVRFTFNLGPKIAYMISDRHSGDGTPKCDVDEHEIYNRFDYGICGGPGLEVHIRRHVIFLDARFYYGLGNAFSTKDVGGMKYSASTSYGGTVTLGYLIRTNRGQ